MRAPLTRGSHDRHETGDSGITPSRQLAEPMKPSRSVHHKEERPLVMLVDDDPAIGIMFGIGLEAIGFRVEVVCDVSAMFQAIEKEMPDVVVLDFQLGGIITGVDALENLRLDWRAAQVPVLMLSNHPGNLDGQTDRAFAAGALAWLAKSKTSPAELGLHISQALASTVGDLRQETHPGSFE